jgi:hypothetical protein
MAEYVPDSRLDRIVEALRRAVLRLPAEWDLLRAEMSDPDTLLGIAILLAAYVGLQFTLLGPIADVIAAIAGAFAIASTAAGLIGAAFDAAQAESEAQLDAAAAKMAREITALGVEAVSAVLGYAAFKRLKQLAKASRGKLLRGRLWEGAAGPGAAGAGTAITTNAPAVGSAASTVLKVGIPTVLLVLLIALALRRGR